MDLLALYLCGTYCRKTCTRPPSCQAPRQQTIYKGFEGLAWNVRAVLRNAYTNQILRKR